MDIYATDGSGLPTGTSLGTSSTIAGTSLTTSYTSNTFTFSTPVTLTQSTKYAWVLSRSGATSDTNFYNLSSRPTDPYAGGNFVKDNTSLVWSNTATADSNCTINAATGYLNNYYFFGRDGTTATTLQAFKSTAPDTSWASIATKTGFTTAILNIAAYQVGNVIHLLVQDGTMSSSVATKYLSYDMATDTFLATTETVSAAQALTGQISSGFGCSLVVRSNGEVVTFYSGLQVKVSGTFRAQVYYRRRTALNTYGTETTLDGVLAVDNRSPIAVLGATDRIHLLWFNGTNTLQRHLTSANVLGTAGTAITGTALLQDVDTYDDAGTLRVIGVNATTAFRFNSADNPTISQASVAFGLPARGVDDSGNPYFIYQNSADSDLYVKTSTDDGATWGSATSAFVGTVASADANLSKNQRSYTRGSSVVLPYIVNDNGTLKYNEAVIRSVAATGTGTLAAQAVSASGAGVSSSDGTGALLAVAAAVSGSGTVTTAAATGTGAVAADVSSVSGAGVSSSVATGALSAPAATAAGAGISASTGAGALTAQDAVASGAGFAVSTGSGAALTAANATASGAGTSASIGTGALAAGSAEVAGTGSAAEANTGALVAQAAVVAGLGISVSTGAGAIQADAANIAGIGLAASAGNGALVAGAVTVAGEGVVIDAGAIFGAGALTAGAATVAGEGEVAGEVVPPIFVGGGYWRQRPFAVEGVGYGILPQLEGEAYGAVVVAGAGVAILPGLRGAAAGTVGVAGRSAARLAVKVAAVGDRGQVGAAVAVLKGFTVSAAGVAGVRGTGSGVVNLEIKGAATGRHDDDEAAVVTLLLAA